MTDKQIIIDDCIHLDEWKHCDICEKLIKTKDGANGKKREHLLTEADLRCDFYPNCYYKQLKRKEQECEELKNERTIDLVKQLDQLKAENERLQEEREKAKNYNLEYGKLLIKATNENKKLKQTLTEIKEIADDFYLDGEHCKVESLALEILRKISEVEE